MRYSGIIRNDIAAGDGVCVTLFTQGCPIHCPGCQNPETWAFDGGRELTQETIDTIVESIKANGVQRNFALMGGEPLCNENAFLSFMITQLVKEKYPNIKVWIWSGYTYEELLKSNNAKVQKLLELADYLVAGPYVAAERDITLAKRGSRNQRIIDLKEKKDVTERYDSRAI